jgi:hypothetical protein
MGAISSKEEKWSEPSTALAYMMTSKKVALSNQRSQHWNLSSKKEERSIFAEAPSKLNMDLADLIGKKGKAKRAKRFVNK